MPFLAAPGFPGPPGNEFCAPWRRRTGPCSAIYGRSRTCRQRAHGRYRPICCGRRASCDPGVRWPPPWPVGSVTCQAAAEHSSASTTAATASLRVVHPPAEALPRRTRGPRGRRHPIATTESSRFGARSSGQRTGHQPHGAKRDVPRCAARSSSPAPTGSSTCRPVRGSRGNRPPSPRCSARCSGR